MNIDKVFFHHMLCVNTCFLSPHVAQAHLFDSKVTFWCVTRYNPQSSCSPIIELCDKILSLLNSLQLTFMKFETCVTHVVCYVTLWSLAEIPFSSTLVLFQIDFSAFTKILNTWKVFTVLLFDVQPVSNVYVTHNCKYSIVYMWEQRKDVKAGEYVAVMVI